MTPVLPPVPNLIRLSIDNLDFEHCSPSFPRILSILPNSCRTDICGQTIDPGSLPKLIRFLRRAKSHYFACDINSNLGSGRAPEPLTSFPSSLQRAGRSLLTKSILRVGKCTAYLCFDGFDAGDSSDSLRNMGPYLEEVEIEVRPKGPSEWISRC